MVAWRYEESLPICEQALALARGVGAREAEVRALTVLGGDLAYLGRGEEGLAHFRQALQLAEEIGDPVGLERAYVNFTDVLTMLGRPRESARLGQAGLEAMRRYGIDSTLLVANQIEALLAIGDWDEADSAQRAPRSAASPPASRTGCSSSAPTSRSAAASSTPRERTSRPRAPPCARTAGSAIYDVYLAELALWERRWTDADAAVRDGLARARASAKPRRSASGSARRDCAPRRSWPRSRAPAATPTPSATGSPGRGSSSPSPVARPRKPQRSRRTPRAGCALAEAEYARARGAARPELVVGGGRRPGSGSNARRSRRTAAGVRPRRSSRPAPPAPRRPCRSGRRTPSRPGSEPSRCCASSNCSPSARGSTSRPRTAALTGQKHEPRGDPRPDPTRGRGPDPRRPRLHQPRDRRDARDQHQDRQRPRLAHPAQARGAEQARGSRDRPPPHPATRRASLSQGLKNPGQAIWRSVHPPHVHTSSAGRLARPFRTRRSGAQDPRISPARALNRRSARIRRPRGRPSQSRSVMAATEPASGRNSVSVHGPHGPQRR